MTQSLNYASTAEPGGASEALRQRFQETAGEFNRNVAEAAGRLGAAADQLLSITEAFANAGDRLEGALESHRQREAGSQQAAQDARSSADDARAAADSAREALHATEALQGRLEASYADIAILVRDLQERIGALAILARPMPHEAVATPSPVAPVASPPAAEPAGVFPGSGWTPEALQQSDS
jgi:ABC-type transporter Mla subunit MlaD